MSDPRPEFDRGVAWARAETLGSAPSAVIEIEFDSRLDAARAGFGSRIAEIQTIRCRHCRRDFRVSKGSGARRGYCRRCGGPHCGAPGCFTHCPKAAAAAQLLIRSIESARRAATLG
jgi:hypothetical protein